MIVTYLLYKQHKVTNAITNIATYDDKDRAHRIQHDLQMFNNDYYWSIKENV
jgi:hypothetical protein